MRFENHTVATTNSAPQKLRDTLEKGIAELCLKPTPALYDQLLKFLDLLKKWNKTYNLTAILAPEQMIIRHVLDSLAIVPPLFEEEKQKNLLNNRNIGTQETSTIFNRLIDVGSGCGVPGVVLAIIKPTIPVSLIESNGKKTAFLRQCKIELGLDNLNVIQSRAEEYVSCSNEKIIVVCRGFSSISTFLKTINSISKNPMEAAAMKGSLNTNELKTLPCHWKLKNIVRLKVPFLEEERHLIRFQNFYPDFDPTLQS